VRPSLRARPFVSARARGICTGISVRRSLHTEMSLSAGGILKGISVRRSLWSEMYVKAGGI